MTRPLAMFEAILMCEVVPRHNWLMPADVKSQMISSAAELIARHGVAATSFAMVLVHSGAPRGSIYHHFPGGKDQLVEAAVSAVGDQIIEQITQAMVQGDPSQAVRRMALNWAASMQDNGFVISCPMVAVVIDGAASAVAQEIAREKLLRSQGVISETLLLHGMDVTRAASVALTVMAALEGAVILSRAQRSAAPLRQVANEMADYIAALLAKPHARM